MNTLFSQSYSIAGLVFVLQSDMEIISSEEFARFIQRGTADYQINFEKIEMPKINKGILVAREMGFNVYKADESFLYEYVDVNNKPYAFSRVEVEQNKVIVRYLQDALRHISHTKGAFFHIRWEELLLYKKRLILHACCIESSYGGILFSGVSGIGKSTQGSLWCEHEGAKLINGDRPILHENEDGWYAYGAPYAGSSKCHVNEKTKIRAVILLAQAKSCSIRKLEKVEAFKRIFSQVTIAAWNPKSIENACSLVEQLISKIPVYEMKCTPDKEAVELLKRTITEEVSR